MSTRKPKIVYPEFGKPQDIPLVEGIHTGRERMRELERLLETARHIRQEAEREVDGDLAEADALVRRRIEAAERIRHKAEAELRQLRLAEARHRLRERPPWTPGDPLRDAAHAKDDSRPDFEIALLLGKTGRTLPEQPLDLATDPAPASVQAASRTQPAASSPESRPQTPRERLPLRRQPRHRRPWFLGAILLSLLGLGTGWYLTDPDYRSRLDPLASAARAQWTALRLGAAARLQGAGPELVTRLAAEEAARRERERREREAAWQARLDEAWQRAREAGLARFLAAREAAIQGAAGSVAVSPVAAPAGPRSIASGAGSEAPADAPEAASAVPVAAPGPVSAPAEPAASGAVLDALRLPAAPSAGSPDASTAGTYSK